MPTNHIELFERVLEVFENNFCDCDNCEICELRQEIEDYINNR